MGKEAKSTIVTHAMIRVKCLQNISCDQKTELLTQLVAIKML